MMVIIGWVMLGLFAGYIASTLANGRGEGLTLDIVLGIVGALIGGRLFGVVSTPGTTETSVWSHLTAVLGASLVLLVWHAIRRSTRNT